MAIQLLDQLPVSWMSKRLKYAAPLRTLRTVGSSDDAEYIGLENIESWTGRFLPSSSSTDVGNEEAVASGTTSSFSNGDVLFGKLRPYLAKVLLAKRNGTCSTELLVLQPGIELDARFLFYVLLCPEFVTLVDSSTFGAKMPRANWDFIGNIRVPLPNLKDQRFIASYLEDETAQIDSLIAEKERMLSLLEEKRAALVNHAVTCGLDPNAPMKPSGLEWLEDIPVHWETRRLKHLCENIDTGTTPSARYMEDPEDGDFIWFTPGDFNATGELVDSRRKVPTEAVEKGEAKLFPDDSVLIVGIGATLGKVGLAKMECSANQQINVIINCNDIRPEYLKLVLLGYETVFKAHAYASTLAILNQERLGVISVPLPPIEEQEAIEVYCRKVSDRITPLKLELESSVALLKERRSALITAAVTGQIEPEVMTT